MELVLASQSRYRRELLDRLKIPYVAASHECDERALEPAGASPDEVARALARAKAESLARRYPDACILGSDQVVDVDGAILGKPRDRADALAQLALLQGREHRLITAVALRLPDGSVDEGVEVHIMRMRPLGAEERARYVDMDTPLDCCGSYRIESRGIALFEEIRGSDFTAIMGLPLMTVVSMLRRAGAALP